METDRNQVSVWISTNQEETDRFLLGLKCWHSEENNKHDVTQKRWVHRRC